MKTIELKVNIKNKEIEKTAERVKKLDAQFFDLIEDSDFADFLKTIYEKLHKHKHQNG